MRLTSRLIAVVALIGIAGSLLTLAWSGDTPDRVTLTPIMVSANAGYFEGEAGMANADNRGFMSNAGFVIAPEGVVIFDALATPALAHAMLAAIRERTRAPIRHVVVSHYHADHVYGLQVFADEGAVIWAHQAGADYLRSEAAAERLEERRTSLAPWVNNATRLVPATRWLTLSTGEVESFTVGDRRFDIIGGGGAHSPSDLMLRVPGEGVLFAGDLFFTGRIPFVVDGDTRAWLEALTRIAESSVSVVVPGHGPASTDVASDLNATQGYLNYLRSQLGEAVDNFMSFDEAFEAIDWTAYEAMPLFEAAHRRNAYSIFLELEAESLK
jgi:glyoxylase-like metal-dependent hydrolase (beta-lactamase superfamily II)